MRQKANQKVEESKEDLEELFDDYEDLEAELKTKMEQITVNWDELANDVEVKEVKPRRSDVKVEQVMLAWIPYWVEEGGKRVSALR